MRMITNNQVTTLILGCLKIFSVNETSSKDFNLASGSITGKVKKQLHYLPNYYKKMMSSPAANIVLFDNLLNQASTVHIGPSATVFQGLDNMVD